MKIKDIETGEELEAVKTDSGDYQVGEETLTPQEMKLRYIRVKEGQEAPVNLTEPTNISVQQEVPLKVIGDSIGELFKAVSAAQGDLMIGTKDKSGYGYKYMPLPQVLELGREPLAKHGLSLTQFPSTYMVGKMKMVRVTSVLAHESGAYIESSFDIEVKESKKQALVQTVGSLVTYLSRYARTNMLGIAADDDKDGADTL